MYSAHDLYIHCLINLLEIKDKKNLDIYLMMKLILLYLRKIIMKNYILELIIMMIQLKFL